MGRTCRMGILRGMGILPWNGHLAVEWASCRGMGILPWNGHLAVEWASCRGMGILPWNGHLAVEWASCRGMGILPVSFSGGQDARSTPIHFLIQQR
ncbi:hypothetical protein [Moorena sp. SIO3I6]|uniref:hypothetical protein n=1 Tax=Moorena sp. SIO3I6 TaxID=2607831 RepID=UPI0025EB6D64|nr:hypothetical protein [Moorena sp. SIO3I6]